MAVSGVSVLGGVWVFVFCFTGTLSLYSFEALALR